METSHLSRTTAWSRASAIAGAAVLLSWPAIYNRFPLLYPDSISYLDDGRDVARALLLRQFSQHYGIRSLIYSLGILPFHWNASAWPVVALQSFLAAWVIWLVVRSVAPRVHAERPRTFVVGYLAVIVFLSAATSLSWFTSLVMPDVLGPLVCLCLYLLVFARESLTRGERLAVAAFAWWGATSHLTHLMLAVGLCALLVLLAPLGRFEMRRHWRGVWDAALVTGLAAAGQLALNGYLYHRLSLSPEAPPYVMARVIGDGPGRWYLEQHCWAGSGFRFTLCDYTAKLSDNADDFLWGPHGVWPTAPDEAKERMAREQWRFVLAAVRAYPTEQWRRSASNFWQQLFLWDVYVVDSNEWMSAHVGDVLAGRDSGYAKSRQAHEALPLDLFSDVVYWVTVGSLALIIVFALLLRGRLWPRLAGLAVIVFASVVANALVTAVLSNVEDRYQSRVVWLIPLLASTLAFSWIERRVEAQTSDPVRVTAGAGVAAEAGR